MLYARLVQFLQMAIATFTIEHLLFVGDNETLDALIHIHHRLNNAILPAIVVSTTPGHPSNGTNFCPDCPTSQLTLIYMSNYANFEVAKYFVLPNYTVSNRIVLLPPGTITENGRLELADLFSFFNLAMVIVYVDGTLNVLAWCRRAEMWHGDTVSAFDGIDFFQSQDINALLFRQELQNFPPARTVSAHIYAIMMAPFWFLLRDEASGKLWLASTSLTVFQIIGDRLRFAVNVYFYARSNCSACFEPLPMPSNRGLVTLFDYEAIVRYDNDRSSPDCGLIVTQNGFAAMDNAVFEIRRYLAIVPYRSGGQAGEWTLANAMLNVAALLVWLVGAIVFTLLRHRMRRVSGNTDGHCLPIFFKCLAGVLGNSAGQDHSMSHGESLAKLTIGVFAMLTSCLFTGTLFEQLVGVEPVRQINTMTELAASNMTIVECFGEYLPEERSRPNPSFVETKYFASVGDIELELLKHATWSAFVLPESIADVVHHPALRYTNGTPVYHVVTEPYRISMEFIAVVPFMMQNRLMSLWSRLVESGINAHVERKTTDLYRAARSEWFVRQNGTAKASNDEHNDSGSNEMILLLLVLCIGHSMAGVAFLFELVWASEWRITRFGGD